MVEILDLISISISYLALFPFKTRDLTEFDHVFPFIVNRIVRIYCETIRKKIAQCDINEEQNVPSFYHEWH